MPRPHIVVVGGWRALIEVGDGSAAAELGGEGHVPSILARRPRCPSVAGGRSVTSERRVAQSRSTTARSRVANWWCHHSSRKTTRKQSITRARRLGERSGGSQGPPTRTRRSSSNRARDEPGRVLPSPPAPAAPPPMPDRRQAARLPAGRAVLPIRETDPGHAAPFVGARRRRKEQVAQRLHEGVLAVDPGVQLLAGQTPRPGESRRPDPVHEIHGVSDSGEVPRAQSHPLGCTRSVRPGASRHRVLISTRAHSRLRSFQRSRNSDAEAHRGASQ